VSAGDGGGGDPQVMIDRTGVATVVWVRAIPAHERDDALQVMATTRRPNGLLATTAVTPTQLVTSHPSLGANARGDAVVAFDVCRPPVFDNLTGECATWNGAQAAIRPAGGRRFRAPRPVSQQGDGNASFIVAHMTSSRRAMILWKDDLGLRLAQSHTGRSWSISTLSGTPLGAALVAGDAAGRGVIAWGEGLQGSGGDESIKAAAFAADGEVGPVQQVSDVVPFNQTPSLAVSASGQVLLTWTRAAIPGQLSLQYSTTTLG
jgi:hypothetical protein